MSHVLISRTSCIVVVATVTLVCVISVAITHGVVAPLFLAWSDYLGDGQPWVLPWYAALSRFIWLHPVVSLVIGSMLCRKSDVRLEHMIVFTCGMLLVAFLWLSVSVASWLAIQAAFIPIGR